MKEGRFFILFLLMLTAQILVSNYLNFSQLLLINILPALILCVPTRIKGYWLLIIAFATAFLADFFAGGMLGLTATALLPAALLRNGIIRLVFGDELFSRQEDISVARQGVLKASFAILLILSVFFIIFIWVDAAGTRPFWFLLLKFFLSLLASYLVSLLVVETLNP